MSRRLLSCLCLLAIAVCVCAAADHETRIVWNDDHGRTELDIQGTVEFTDNDSDVKSVSPDGYFRMEEWSGGAARLYVVRPGSSGTLDRSYYVDGISKPLDNDARAWLSRVLPEVIRETAIGASDRVKRILRQQGAAGVFAEIGRIHSDGARRIYIGDLIETANLKADDLRESMRLARKISSDGEKARLLVDVASYYQNPSTREDYFETTNTISSDGEHRRVLSNVLDHYGVDRESMTLSLRSAKRISSDGEKARVLMQAADYRLVGEETRQSYFHATDSINSDGEHRRVLSAVLKRNSLDKDIQVRVLRSAGYINSDGEKAAILTEAAAAYVEDTGVRKAFFDAANTINSDGERRRALDALLRRGGNPSADTLREAAKSASRISSDGEKANVLAVIPDLGLRDPATVEAFFAAANTISSDGEHARVLLAALNASLEKDAVITLIHSAERINSDGEKARVLMRAIDRCSKDAAVVAAIRDAARTIHSDGEYRRVMSMLDREATI